MIILHDAEKAHIPQVSHPPTPTKIIRNRKLNRINLQFLRSDVGSCGAIVDGVLTGQSCVRLLNTALAEPRQRDFSTALCRFHRYQIHFSLCVFVKN